MIFYVLSDVLWTEGGYQKQGDLAKYSFQAGVIFMLIAHYIFSMEYFKAALNLPIIMNIFSADS